MEPSYSQKMILNMASVRQPSLGISEIFSRFHALAKVRHIPTIRGWDMDI